MTSTGQAVLFDLDGTLLDTAQDLVGALNHVRVHEGHEKVPVADYRQYVSQGALGLIRAGLPDEGPQREQERREQFLGYYQNNLLRATRAFGGVEQVLEELERRAIPWCVVTNKPEYLTIPIVNALGWGRRAASVICGDTLSTSKPDPAPVLLACELAGVNPSGALMVGDDPRDIEAGQNAGASSVLVSYGYGADVVMSQGPRPEFIIDSPMDLLDLLAGPDTAQR